jgi:hypothetical protein
MVGPALHRGRTTVPAGASRPASSGLAAVAVGAGQISVARRCAAGIAWPTSRFAEGREDARNEQLRRPAA